MHIERRRAPRVEVLGQIHGEIVSMDVPMKVREVSLGGLSFGSPVSFPEGAVHDFRLTLGDNTEVLLRGRVVRTHEKIDADASRLFITGVQFIEDEPGDEGSPVSSLIEKIK